MRDIVEKYESERKANDEMTAAALAAALRMNQFNIRDMRAIENLMIIVSALEYHAKAIDSETLRYCGLVIENGKAKWIK